MPFYAMQILLRQKEGGNHRCTDTGSSDWALSRNSHARGARVSCMLSVLLDAAFLHDFGLDVV